MFASVALKLLLKLGQSLLTEKFLEWALFWSAEQLVKSTKTSHDDEWLNKIKEVTSGHGQK
jgi:HKD family nuclease